MIQKLSKDKIKVDRIPFRLEGYMVTDGERTGLITSDLLGNIEIKPLSIQHIHDEEIEAMIKEKYGHLGELNINIFAELPIDTEKDLYLVGSARREE